MTANLLSYDNRSATLKETGVRILRGKLTTWYFQQRTWREANKTQVHLVAEKAENQTIVLSNDVPGVLGTTILVKLTTTERKTTLGILAGPQRFVSQDNVMPQRLAFCNCTQRSWTRRI